MSGEDHARAQASADRLLERVRPELERRTAAVGLQIGGRVNDLVAIVVGTGSSHFAGARPGAAPHEIVRDADGEILLGLRTALAAMVYFEEDEDEPEPDPAMAALAEAIWSHRDERGEILPDDTMPVVVAASGRWWMVTHVQIPGLPPVATPPPPSGEIDAEFGVGGDEQADDGDGGNNTDGAT